MNAVDIENGATRRGARPFGDAGQRMGHQPRAPRDRCQMREIERILLPGIALQSDGDAEFYGPRGSTAGGTRGNFHSYELFSLMLMLGRLENIPHEC